MGSTCGILKQKDELNQVIIPIIPIKPIKHLKSAPPPDEKEAKIGKYYTKSSVGKENFKK